MSKKHWIATRYECEITGDLCFKESKGMYSCIIKPNCSDCEIHKKFHEGTLE